MTTKKEKYETLAHNGPLFPEPYQSNNVTLKGKKLSLPLEERLYKYSGYFDTEYWTNPTFMKNASVAILEVADDPKLSFPGDYEEAINQCRKIISDKKEAKKNLSKKEKEAEKKKKEALKEKYGYALLNGEKVPLGAFMIEGSGPFITRGVHPRLGCWKKMAMPEDIRINLSKGEKIPEHPFPGHNWQSVKENKNAMWILDYDVPGGLHKFIGFSYNSNVKQISIKDKYDHAINLLKNWDKVEKYIRKHLNFRDVKTAERAMVAYLIMKLGIRIGNEKGEDEADTVGASTLRVENVSLDGNNTVTLNFLGKDSVRYTNTVQIDKEAYDELEGLYKNKSPRDYLFPTINTTDVNSFLQEALPGLTAKQFRSSLGSYLFAKELLSQTYNSNVNESLVKFKEANLAVGVKLNHKKTINKDKFNQSLQKMDEQILSRQKRIEEQQKGFQDKFLNIEQEIIIAKKTYSGEKLSEKLESLKEKKDKLLRSMEKANENLHSLVVKKGLKEKTQDVALGTSLNSYIDPRVVYSWSKLNNVPIEKIYSKAQLERFSWAKNTNEKWISKYVEDATVAKI